jgi:hypothetical protein
VEREERGLVWGTVLTFDWRDWEKLWKLQDSRLRDLWTYRTRNRSPAHSNATLGWMTWTCRSCGVMVSTQTVSGWNIGLQACVVTGLRDLCVVPDERWASCSRILLRASFIILSFDKASLLKIITLLPNFSQKLKDQTSFGWTNLINILLCGDNLLCGVFNCKDFNPE